MGAVSIAMRLLPLLLLVATDSQMGDVAEGFLLPDLLAKEHTGQSDVDQIVHKVQQEAPQLFMGTEELAKAAGFAVEAHEVRTDDGYLLTLHRLSRAGGPANADAKRGAPLLLVHGFLCASELFLLTGPEHALAYQLVDRGYDVWMANMRGNTYSRKHETLSPQDVAFWNFSWHEMGIYDIPAFVDHVLSTTGHPNLYYVSHSMGNTVYYVMTTMRPEYNDKVRLHVGLSPAVYMSRARTPVLHLLAGSLPALTYASTKTPEFMPDSPARSAFVHLVCNRANELCLRNYAITYGPAHPGLNATRAAYITVHLMHSTSLRTGLHFAQVFIAGRFRQWDEGSEEGNKKRYGETTPPEYDLKRSTAPSAIFYSEDDAVVDRKDVEQLAQEQSKVVLLHLVPDRPYNHMDFLVASNADEMVFKHVFKILSNF